MQFWMRAIAAETAEPIKMLSGVQTNRELDGDGQWRQTANTMDQSV